MKRKVFRSRISVLLVCFILATFISGAIPMIKHMIISGLYILCGTFLFVVFLFCGMRYIISENRLYLKMWFIPNGSVNIEDVVSVERSYNLLSSPAASLKRLRIGLGGKAKFPYTLISPAKEQEFIEELRIINPDIYVRVPVKKGIWRFWDWDI